jgi:hypothetical protein
MDIGGGHRPGMGQQGMQKIVGVSHFSLRIEQAAQL